MGSQLDPKKQAQYNKELEKAKDIQDSQTKSVEDLKQSLQDVLFLTRDYASEARSATKAILENTIQASAAAKSFKDLSSSSRDITREYGEIAVGAKKYSDISKDIVKLEKNKQSLAVEQQQALSKILTTTRFGAEAQDDINAAMKSTSGLQDVMFKYAQDLTTEEQYLLDLYNQQNVALEEQKGEIEQISTQSKNIGDASSLFGDSAVGIQDVGKGLDGVLNKLGMSSISDKLGLGEASKGAREYGAELTKNGTQSAKISDKFKTAGKFSKSMATNLAKSLGPATAISFFVGQMSKAFKLIDGASGDMAKNYGISNSEAQKLVARNNKIAKLSGHSALNTEVINKAQASLNAEFGTSTKFSAELSSEFGLIQKRLGLSAETMGRLTVLSLANNGNMMDQLETIQGVTLELNNQEGVSLNQRDIQEGLSQLSASQLIANKMNTKELTNQVFQAKLLGISQSQLEGVSSNLLDFSSSIEAEMQAELLTNKELNLEKARAAALTGDHATVAQELRREMEGLTDEQKKNPIILGQFAKALGMGKDELAAALVEQQKLDLIRGKGFKSMSDAQEKYNQAVKEGNLDEVTRLQLIGDGVGKQLESANMQERMNDVTAKFTDMFVRLAEPLIPLIDKLVNGIIYLEPIMGTLAGAIGGFMIGGPVGAAIGALAGGGFDLQRAFGDEVDPKGGAVDMDPSSMAQTPQFNFKEQSPTTKMPALATGGIVTKPTTALIGEGGEPEAVIPLSKAPSMGFGGGNDGINQTNALLKELIGAVKQGGDVYIDGAKAGKSLALATSRMG